MTQTKQLLIPPDGIENGEPLTKPVTSTLKSERAKVVYAELMELARKQDDAFQIDETRGTYAEIMTLKLQKASVYAEQVRQAISTATSIDIAHQQLLVTAGVITTAALKDR